MARRRRWTVIGYYIEEGQIIADEILAHDAYDAFEQQRKQREEEYGTLVQIVATPKVGCENETLFYGDEFASKE
jgi:hypothetical protein